MLWFLFSILFGDVFLTFFAALHMAISGQMDADDASFFEGTKPFFPENFLSRYPHEAHADRLKIIGYLIFHLLVKGHSSVDPSQFWSGYNLDDYNRAVIDAVFYEYLSNFTDREAKDLVFNPLEDSENHLATLLSNEEIAAHRVGQYLDLLSEAESKREMKNAADILSEGNESPTRAKRQVTECYMSTEIKTSGVPGKDYPNFCDIPETSFFCAGKPTPGIYADYDTGCQVFHVCWPSRSDSFLCPIGTIFNQSLLTCGIWHDTGCFSSPLFQSGQFPIDGISTGHDMPWYDGSCENLLIKPLRRRMKFRPDKCEVRNKLGGIIPDPSVKARNEMIYNLIKEILQVLRKMRKDSNDGGSPGNRGLEKYLRSILKSSTETVEDAEFTRKLGETDFKKAGIAGQSGKLSAGMKTDRFVTRSTLIKPSESLEEHMSLKKQDVPEMLMRSLKFGGAILNEGIIPLAKQIVIDSYRKIESKKH